MMHDVECLQINQQNSPRIRLARNSLGYDYRADLHGTNIQCVLSLMITSLGGFVLLTYATDRNWICCM